MRIETQGQTAPSNACMSLVLLGDLVSIYLATLRGVDPRRSKRSRELKAELGELLEQLNLAVGARAAP